MATDRRRLFELALRGLESERDRINAEIDNIQSELGRARGRRAETSSAVGGRRRSKFSSAERRRRAERMRQYWADRRAAKVSGAGSANRGVRRKPRFSAAERKRRADRMRQYWADRRKAARR